MHIKLKLKIAHNKPVKYAWSEKERISAFHVAIHRADPDWPFAISSQNRKILDADTPVQCADCEGMIYVNPSVGPSDMICLANQLGLMIEKMVCIKEEDCHGKSARLGARLKQYHELMDAKEDTEKSLLDQVLSTPEDGEATVVTATLVETDPSRLLAAPAPVAAESAKSSHASACESAFGYRATVGRDDERFVSGRGIPPSWESDEHFQGYGC